MEQIVATIYAACLSAEAEPHAELVDLTIQAIQDGLAGPNKNETLNVIFESVEELTNERRRKGALFRIKLTAIASAAKGLPQNTREALLKSLRAMEEVANQNELNDAEATTALLRQTIEKMQTTAVTAPMVESHAPTRESSTPKVEPQEARTMGLVDFLKSKGVIFAGSEKIFFAPNIPLKKINGAMQSIARWASPGEIAILVDDTVFGGAKEGVFFTDEWMVVKEIMTDPSPYQLKDIVTIGAEGRKVYVNSIEIVTLNIPEKRELSLLFSAVHEYIQALKGASNSAPPQPSPKPSQPERPSSAQSGAGNYQTFFDKHIAMLASEDLFGDALAYRQLLVELLRNAGSLPLFFKRNDIPLTPSQLGMARGDGLLLEAFFYLFTVMQTLLVNTCDFSWEQAVDFLVGMILPALIPYVDYVEAGGRGRSLREAAVPATVYEDSILMTEFRNRTQHYRDLMDSNVHALPAVFRDNLCHPAVIELLPDAEAQQFGTKAYELVMEVLSEEGVFEFMRDISVSVEQAMTRFFEMVNG